MNHRGTPERRGREEGIERGRRVEFFAFAGGK
jgi:hypothetical protein